MRVLHPTRANCQWRTSRVVERGNAAEIKLIKPVDHTVWLSLSNSRLFDLVEEIPSKRRSPLFERFARELFFLVVCSFPFDLFDSQFRFSFDFHWILAAFFLCCSFDALSFECGHEVSEVIRRSKSVEQVSDFEVGNMWLT